MGLRSSAGLFFFFFNDTATTEIYTLSLHDALPIFLDGIADRYDTPYFDNLQKYAQRPIGTFHALPVARGKSIFKSNWRSEEHTSELQSRLHLVCRLLLEKKKHVRHT